MKNDRICLFSTTFNVIHIKRPICPPPPPSLLPLPLPRTPFEEYSLRVKPGTLLAINLHRRSTTQFAQLYRRRHSLLLLPLPLLFVPFVALYSLFTERLGFLKHNKGPVALVSEKSFEDINELLEREM